MLFNTPTFVVFFVCVFASYWLLRDRVKQNVLLLLASYIFYGAWSWKFLLLMLGSTLVDYVCGLLIGSENRPSRRRALLVASLTVNLGVLFAFKYLGFFVEETAHLLAQLGLNASMPILEIVLPVGISFYTFQSIGYVVDVYRQKVKPTRNLLHYALYVAFFPQLVAGPIERAAHLIPQFENDRTWKRGALESGLFLMVWGLFKKVAIADNLAPYVDAVYAEPSSYSGIAIVSAIVFFAFQIYCDFSGYTDTARGAARTLGFELIRNFDDPYVARNPVDFWRRWHISLSQWFQDYLYYPLALRYMRGGGWGSKYKAHIIAMTLIGVWHGANWTYLLFGLYWGVLIALYLYWSEYAARARPTSLARRVVSANGPSSRLLSIAAMFVFVCIGWVLFRADSLGDATTLLSGIFSIVGEHSPARPGMMSASYLWLLIAGLLVAEWVARHRPERVVAIPGQVLAGPLTRSVLLTAVLFSYLAAQAGTARPFIYFQF